MVARARALREFSRAKILHNYVELFLARKNKPYNKKTGRISALSILTHLKEIDHGLCL